MLFRSRGAGETYADGGIEDEADYGRDEDERSSEEGSQGGEVADLSR